MEILIIFIVLIVIVVFVGNKDAEAKKNREVVKDLLNRDYEEKKQRLEAELAEKEAQMSRLEREEKRKTEELADSKMLITKATFEEMCLLLKDVWDMIRDICREGDFQKYILGIKSGSDNVDNSQRMFESLKFFIVQDVLRNYERLGHVYYSNDPLSRRKKCVINYGTPEGQLLYAIVMQAMELDKNGSMAWEGTTHDMLERNTYSDNIRKAAVEALNTYANADVKASASNGLDDFAFCIILHNYNKGYENEYRRKMLRIANVIANADGKVSDKENKWLDSIMNVGADDSTDETATTVEHPEEALNGLIGLGKVKSEINTLCNFIIMKKKREEEGMTTPSLSYHCVFAGNPGTGKTTVARLLAGIYKDLGVLKKGHLVETDRSGLVAEYVGQTAVKTNKIIDEALDGVLFIDEAYTLANGGSNDYGPEAIATLLKRMEDDRERLVVILAGYGKEIETFINSNPGLRSRFNRYIHFDDYTAEELYDIFCLLLKKNEYTLSCGAQLFLKEHLAKVVAEKTKDFGNARYVRNLFEKTVEAQANRLASQPKLRKEDLSMITLADISGERVASNDDSGAVALDYQSYNEAKNKTLQQRIGEESSTSSEADSEKQFRQSTHRTSYQDDGFGETIEVSYAILGDDEETIDVEVKERDYEWLTNKDEDGECLDSDFLSENRRGLHKRILRAIREHIEEDSYDDAVCSDFDDDDVEYTVNVY